MIKIVKASKTECQKIRLLEQKVHQQKDITSQYDAFYFVEYGYVYIAKEKDEIIGAIVAIKTRKNEIKILDWIVKKEHQHKGIGTRLYQKLFKETTTLPLLSLVGKDNQPSLNGHIKIGFKKVKTIKDPFQIGEKKYYYLLRKTNQQPRT